MINHKFGLDKSFQEILYRINNWIKEGSGWIGKLIDSQYINISTYRPLSGRSYVKLPAEFRSPKKKILINIKNNDKNCFLWCHVRHLNPVKIHPERITQTDNKLVNGLDYDGIKFPVDKEDFSKNQTKKIWINVYCYENKLVFPIQFSDQKFENSMDFLLATDGNKSHYVYIKDFDSFMFHKTKNKNKKYFTKSCLQCFSSKNVLTEHKEVS